MCKGKVVPVPAMKAQ